MTKGVGPFFRSGFSRDNIAYRKLGLQPLYPFGSEFHLKGMKIKKPREKHEAHKAASFLAKSAGYGGLGGCPDLRRFADHSGGTVADSHGLPHIPNLLDVESKSMSRGRRCQHGHPEVWGRPSQTPTSLPGITYRVADHP